MRDLSQGWTSVYEGQVSISDVPGYIECAAPILQQIQEIWDGRDLSLVLANSRYSEAEIDHARKICKKSNSWLATAIKIRFPFIVIPDGELVLGTGTASGHAVRRGGKLVFWLALETHHTERQIEVFLPHEAAHAIHYSVNPALYPTTEREYHHTGRALWTEGLASFFSKEILSISPADALWADFMSEAWKREWMEYCQVHESEWFEIAIQRFDSVIDKGRWFLMDGTGEFGSSRIGYYLGYRLVEKAASRYPLEELLHLKLNDVRKILDAAAT